MYMTIPQTLSSVRFMLIPGSAPRTITVAVMVEMYDVHAVFCADCGNVFVWVAGQLEMGLLGP